MDIAQLILDDHHEQRRLFAMLDEIAPEDRESLHAVWGRLAAFLEVHATAEEAHFYPQLLNLRRAGGSTVREETADAITDHNEIRDAVAAAEREDVGEDGWYEAVEKVREANGDHMAEEERGPLRDVRRYAEPALRRELAIAFAAFEARHVTGVTPIDRDPERYIAENAGGVTAPPGRGGYRPGSRPD